MSYMALYRKFRPTSFEDVKGQDHIVTALKNQIRAERVGHAYLFCGTRGTGKTTIAKIFAKAVNCENPVDGSPCGTCACCQAIAQGTAMNVIEIDAASNNGVDNIREIRDEVAYSPTMGRYKVYIIDEVHMLSTGAFNALLKTLEEPPSYVIFILATTEVHKIPITILSRCQRYDFRHITADVITARLQELMETEGVKAEEKALRYVAKAADGSMRDALSLLDQCLAFYMDQELTYDRALDVLGAVDTDVYSSLLRKILSGDIPAVMGDVEKLVMQGRELSQFVTDFTWYMRNLLLLKNSEEMAEILDVSTENLKQLKEEAQLVEDETLMRYIRIFSDLASQMKFATQKRILVEVALIKLCRPAMETDKESLLDRIRVLEQEVEQKWNQISETVDEAVARAGASGSFIPMAQGSVSMDSMQPQPEMVDAVPEDIQLVVLGWNKIIGSAHPLLKMMLKDVKLKALGENRLGIIAATPLAEDGLKQDDHIGELERLIESKVQRKVMIQVASTATDPNRGIGIINMKKIIESAINAEIEESDEEFEDDFI